ncbi:MAG: DNA replication/repair protein RecF [Oscillospiraceae bacterium]|nr:DNA replication/repair protein RecF [Oscillospiraceae bacterium]
MNIKLLSCTSFRNLCEFDFLPQPGVNIIHGDNAQGKTNLLEAIWLFTGAKSFRGGRDKDFIQHGKDFCSLGLSFFAQNRPQTAELRYGIDKRIVSLNEIKLERPSQLAGNFCAVVFSPDHMSLVKNGPEHRRRMIDGSLSQAYPKYAKALENYIRALKQRNTLLKDIPYHASLLDMLDIWDKHISDYGGYITAIRAGYIRLLGERAKEVYSGISGGRETLSISYAPGFSGYNPGFDLSACKEALADELARTRVEDLRLGSTSSGPHRDDLEILINGLSARGYGSQGQQRSCILALKLAECEVLEQRSGEAPVIMLDDVMSELDENRRGYLLNHLGDRQIIITCCDASAFSGMRHGGVFEMKDGMLCTST